MVQGTFGQQTYGSRDHTENECRVQPTKSVNISDDTMPRSISIQLSYRPRGGLGGGLGVHVRARPESPRGGGPGPPGDT